MDKDLHDQVIIQARAKYKEDRHVAKFIRDALIEAVEKASASLPAHPTPPARPVAAPVKPKRCRDGVHCPALA